MLFIGLTDTNCWFAGIRGRNDEKWEVKFECGKNSHLFEIFWIWHTALTFTGRLKSLNTFVENLSISLHSTTVRAIKLHKLVHISCDPFLRKPLKICPRKWNERNSFITIAIEPFSETSTNIFLGEFSKGLIGKKKNPFS